MPTPRRAPVSTLAVALILAASVATPPAFAAGVFPADAQACAQGSSRTAEQMAGCLQGLMDAADAELNATYTRALAGLDTASKKKLVASQRAWMAFRTADIAANNGPWRQTHGTELRLAAMTNTLTALRERRDELARLYLADAPAGK